MQISKGLLDRAHDKQLPKESVLSISIIKLKNGLPNVGKYIYEQISCVIHIARSSFVLSTQSIHDNDVSGKLLCWHLCAYPAKIPWNIVNPMAIGPVG